MSAPVALAGDPIVANCAVHVVPGPLGVPTPAPGLPFNAPALVGVVPTVLAMGRPVVVAGCTGVNTPPHVGLHAADPFLTPTMQVGTVVTGSTTVFAGGLPLASMTSVCTVCAGLPGALLATGVTVLVGA